MDKNNESQHYLKETELSRQLPVNDGLSIEELTKIIDMYRGREGASDEVDYLESRGGIRWLTSELKTDLKNGISKDSIAWRVSTYGTNVLDEKPPESNFG